MRKLLVVSAHPDDEILGCGGTVARLTKEGWSVSTLILGEGITSRDTKRDLKKRKTELEALKKQVYKAGSIVGCKDIFLHNFPDNRFDAVALLDIVKVIEKVKTAILPDVIFTHYENDLNIDHQLTYKAVNVATRPMRGETVKEIYSFKILSSTDWSFSKDFRPDVFYDISDTVALKLEAAQIYEKELREFPHPRSLQGIDIDARYWGMACGFKYAEAFKSVRIIK